MEITDEEKKAISELKRLASKWPKSLWLYSGSSNLNVMKYGSDGKPVMVPGHGGFDPEFSITTVNIPNDGGDW